MRILIVSDIHANLWALEAVASGAGVVDHIICAGDVVNYGPAPGAAIAWLREQQAITVRGNHDHAVTFRADPRASPAKQVLAMAMRDWSRSQLSPEDPSWLARLPVSLKWEVDGTRFAVTHGTPLDPLYDYRLTPTLGDAALDTILGGIRANVLVVGHTHLPMVRRHHDLLIVNPGSLGQPLDGDPRASYAIWHDGEVTLHRVSYDLSSAVVATRSLPLDESIGDNLAQILQRARTD